MTGPISPRALRCRRIIIGIHPILPVAGARMGNGGISSGIKIGLRDACG